MWIDSAPVWLPYRLLRYSNKTSIQSDFALPCPYCWQIIFLLLKKGALMRSLVLVKQRKQMSSVLSSSYDIAFPFSCSSPNPSGSSKKTSWTNGHSTVLSSLWTRRDEVFMRLGATNASWRTKKKDVRARHVLKGRFPSRRQVQLGSGVWLEEWKGREWNGTKKEWKSARIDDGEEHKLWNTTWEVGVEEKGGNGRACRMQPFPRSSLLMEEKAWFLALEGRCIFGALLEVMRRVLVEDQAQIGFLLSRSTNHVWLPRM